MYFIQLVCVFNDFGPLSALKCMEIYVNYPNNIYYNFTLFTHEYKTSTILISPKTQLKLMKATV
jgi:hypothetical protein